MALTVNDVLDRLKYESDDAVAKYMDAYLQSATQIVKKWVGKNFDADNEQVQLVIVLLCEYFTDSSSGEKAISGDFIPPQIRVALSGIYTPLVM